MFPWILVEIRLEIIDLGHCCIGEGSEEEKPVERGAGEGLRKW